MLTVGTGRSRHVARLLFRGKSKERIDSGHSPSKEKVDGKGIGRALLRKCHGVKEVLMSNYSYSLLVFVPFCVFFGAFGWNHMSVFTFYMLAIWTLSMLVRFTTGAHSVNSGQILVL